MQTVKSSCGSEINRYKRGGACVDLTNQKAERIGGRWLGQILACHTVKVT